MKLRIMGLCSGVGGLEYGLEQAGIGHTVCQVEANPYRRRVLRRHWPGASLFADVRALPEEIPHADLVCAGFPCQDISPASRSHGGGAGLDGQKSGLWWACRDVIARVRPDWVVLENNGERWRSWVPTVRRCLSELGYRSVPLRIRAADVGAPHIRDRVFVLAHADEEGQPTRPLHVEVAQLRAAAEACRAEWGEPPSRALGMADGVPDRLDRVQACGDAVVWRCAAVVGTLIRSLAQLVSATSSREVEWWGGVVRASTHPHRRSDAMQDESTTERWRPVDGWLGYEVSDLGRVR